MNFEDLTPDEQAWVRENERLWQRAREIVDRHPTLDLSGVYHTLIQMKRTPAERLRKSLEMGRGYAAARIKR